LPARHAQRPPRFHACACKTFHRDAARARRDNRIFSQRRPGSQPEVGNKVTKEPCGLSFPAAAKRHRQNKRNLSKVMLKKLQAGMEREIRTIKKNQL
jgi:hypothetical protein